MKDEQTTRLSQRAFSLLTNGRLEPPLNESIAIILRSTRRNWTRLCLQTLFHCTTQNLNVIIVPDESKLRSADEFIDAGERYHVRVLHPAPGVDLFNLALSFIKEPFFVMLDDSVTVTPDWLTKLLWPFFDDPHIMLSSPISNLTLLGQNPQLAGPATIRKMFEAAQQITADHAGLWTEDSEPAWACLASRSRILSDVGGLDYSLPNHTIRLMDWYLRARLIGHLTAICHDTYIHILKRMASRDEDSESAWNNVIKKWNLPSKQHFTRGIRSPSEIDLSSDFNYFISLSEENLKPPIVSIIFFIDNPSPENFNHTLLSIMRQTYERMEIVVVNKTSNLKVFQLQDTDLIKKGIWLDGEFFRENIYKSVWSMAEGEYVMYVEAGETFDTEHIQSLIAGIHTKRSTAYSRISTHTYKNKNEIPLRYLIHVHPDKSKTALAFSFNPVPSLSVEFNLRGTFQ